MIATALGTNNEYYLRQFLKHNGLNDGNTKLLNYHPAQMTNGLIGNVIDAAAFWNPYLDDCKAALGEKLVIFPPGDYYTVYYCLVARKGFAAANPEVAHQLVLGLSQASRQMRADSQKAIPSLATALPMRQDLLRSIWAAYRFEVQFSDALKAEMLQEAAWIGETDPRAGERATEFVSVLKPSVALPAEGADPIDDSIYR